MFASIDMTEGHRPRLKSNQFEFPSPKGEVEDVRRHSGFDELKYKRSPGPRRSPILAVSDDYYAHLAFAGQPEDSYEMDMKTIEMLALIKGASPEAAVAHVMSCQCMPPSFSEDGQTSTEGSSQHHQSTSEEFELIFDDDYLLGDSYIGYTEDGNLAESVDDELMEIERRVQKNLHLNHPQNHHFDSRGAERDEQAFEPEEEIFDLEL